MFMEPWFKTTALLYDDAKSFIERETDQWDKLRGWGSSS